MHKQSNREIYKFSWKSKLSIPTNNRKPTRKHSPSLILGAITLLHHHFCLHPFIRNHLVRLTHALNICIFRQSRLDRDVRLAPPFFLSTPLHIRRGMARKLLHNNKPGQRYPRYSFLTARYEVAMGSSSTCTFV